MESHPSQINLTNEQKAKEVELLGKEYDAMRAEIVAREGSRMQLTLATLALITISSALAPTLLAGVKITYLIATLLIIAFLFTTLGWAYYQQDQEVGFLAKRIQTISKRIRFLLEFADENSSQIFRYDKQHLEMLWPKGIGLLFTALLTGSRYLANIIPSLIALILAFTIYLSSKGTISPLASTFIMIGVIINALYLLLHIAAGIYAIVFYRGLK